MSNSIPTLFSDLTLNENFHLNQYQLVKKLGSPNKRKFNEVYLIKNESTQELAILKKLVKTDQNKHLWNVLQKESEFNFQHPNLPKTLFFTENEIEVILIRNFQEGISLDVFWKSVKTRDRLDCIQKMVEKLVPIFDELQKNQVVHCDLKPSNILVHKEDNELKFSLIDFGMALKMNGGETRKTLFALGYSAPEIILNRLHLADQSSDIFSLGICIWQLLTGKLPLTHANPSVMTNLQITHPLPSHSAVKKSVQKILNKMCYKHSFKIAPNLMELNEVDRFLQEAKLQRFSNLRQVFEAFSGIQTKSFFKFFKR